MDSRRVWEKKKKNRTGRNRISVKTLDSMWKVRCTLKESEECCTLVSKEAIWCASSIYRRPRPTRWDCWSLLRFRPFVTTYGWGALVRLWFPPFNSFKSASSIRRFCQRCWKRWKSGRLVLKVCPSMWWQEAMWSIRAFHASPPFSQVALKSSQSGHCTDLGGSSPRKWLKQCVFHSSWSCDMYEQLRNQKAHSNTGCR